jgi:large subunit ribosomal protein L18
MSKMGPSWRVPFKRKREGKTDYRQRTKLLRSGKPRLVVRPSLRHITVQVVRATPGGDSTLASAHSSELSKFGWKAYSGNVPAAYLTGLLCGYRAVKAGATEGILDLNMHAPTPQGKVFAALKGVLDAGLKVPHGEKVFPTDERTRGDHIAQYAAKLKSNEDAHRAQFSGYSSRGLSPEDLSEHFKQIKQAITTQHEGRK